MNKITKKLIQLAIEEDVGAGDITSEATIPTSTQGTATIICKQDLVLSGLDVAKQVFETVGNILSFEELKKNGEFCKKGDEIAKIEGSASSLLTAERTALNFLQHLSGIATLTKKFVNAVKDSGVQIVDTRKTIPGFRELEKQAVVHGGAKNHRMGLYDQYLIKNNHIDIAGGVVEALIAAKGHRKAGTLIEVEVRNDAELDSAIEEGADIIMLDNWPTEKINEAIKKIGGRSKIELSGGITLETIKDYARKGIDYISVGELTHSAKAADIHMVIRTKKAG